MQNAPNTVPPVSLAEKDRTEHMSKVWERSSQTVIKTLRWAVRETAMSFDELAMLSCVDRQVIVAIFSGIREIDASTSTLLAATLSRRLGEQATARRHVRTHEKLQSGYVESRQRNLGS